MRILIPMAGEGSRFRKEGYTFPKPLIDVAGKPMIQRVVENFDFGEEYIYLVRKEHLIEYEGLSDLLHRISPAPCRIVEVNSSTEGAACTALLAKEFINSYEELLIVNSDQIVEFSKENFFLIKNKIVDYGAIYFCFKSSHPKWSFVKLDEYGEIIEVAEKKPISDIATCGVYWYSEGRYFVEAAQAMIKADDRVNNEFYIAPVLNFMIDGYYIMLPFYVHKMHSLGTPEDLKYYLENLKNQ